MAIDNLDRLIGMPTTISEEGIALQMWANDACHLRKCGSIRSVYMLSISSSSSVVVLSPLVHAHRRLNT